MSEKRFGRQEPSVWFTLPYTETKGNEAVELYNSTGREALEWQQSLVYDIMAVNDDGLWVHSRFGYSVPRQNGKNEVVAMREFWALKNGERGLHTAHLTMTSTAAFNRLVNLIESAGYQRRSASNPDGYKSGKGRGQEYIQFSKKDGGGIVHFRTRSSTGGLGETFDLLIIDEAQEYKDEHESALKYTIVSSKNPQTILLGTPPTPESSGTVFPKLRRQILRGNRPNSGWEEWSVEKIGSVRDKESWYQTNPSLGHVLTERAIEDELPEDDKDVDFNIQRLGLWISYNQQSAISKNEWAELNVDKLPKLVGKFSIGIKFAKDGSTSALSCACKTADDHIFAECVNLKSMRDGVGWLADFIKSVEGKYSKIYVDGANGVELLNEAMKKQHLKAPVAITVKEFIEANAKFEQAIFDKSLVHMEQPTVTAVVTNCEKRAIGTNGGFGYKALRDDCDIAVLDSIILAFFGASQVTEKPKKTISY